MTLVHMNMTSFGEHVQCTSKNGSTVSHGHQLSMMFQAYVTGILPHLPFLSFPEVLFTWGWNVLYLLIFIYKIPENARVPFLHAARRQSVHVRNGACMIGWVYLSCYPDALSGPKSALLGASRNKCNLRASGREMSNAEDRKPGGMHAYKSHFSLRQKLTMP